MLGEIQEMRSLTYLVALRIRVAIMEKKLDEAVYWLQTGYAMGRHLSQGPIPDPVSGRYRLLRT